MELHREKKLVGERGKREAERRSTGGGSPELGMQRREREVRRRVQVEERSREKKKEEGDRKGIRFVWVKTALGIRTCVGPTYAWRACSGPAERKFQPVGRV